MIGYFEASEAMSTLWEMMNSASIVLLIILLVVHEIALNTERRWHQFARYLRIALVPLILSFGVTVITTIVELVR